MLLTLLPLATWAGIDVTVKPIGATMTYGTVPDVTASMIKIQSIAGTPTASNEQIRAAAATVLTVSGVTATTNAGTASYGLAVTGGEGTTVTVGATSEEFNIYVEGTATMTIDKATSVTLTEVGLAIVPGDLTYYETNGQAVPQPLFSGVPTATCGAVDLNNLTSEVEYSVDNGAHWYPNIADAKGTDAGNYTLKVRVIDNDNHAGAQIEFATVKNIAQATATLSAANITGFDGTFTYGSTSITAGYTDAAVSYANDVTFLYKKGTGAYVAAPDWSTAGAGEWTVKASFAGNSNWSAAEVEKTFNIDKADMPDAGITLPAAISDLKYTGVAQQIFNNDGIGTLSRVYFDVYGNVLDLDIE